MWTILLLLSNNSPVLIYNNDYYTCRLIRLIAALDGGRSPLPPPPSPSLHLSLEVVRNVRMLVVRL